MDGRHWPLAHDNMTNTYNLVTSVTNTGISLGMIILGTIVKNRLEVNEEWAQSKINEKYVECKFLILNKALMQSYSGDV